jgi:hypothetical protein
MALGLALLAPIRSDQRTMELRIWRRLNLGPRIRLGVYPRGITISFGWLTFGRRELRATLPTGVPEAYLTEGRSWKGLSSKQK